MEEVSKERLNWHGRYLDNNGIRYFNYSASGFSFKARAKKVEATFVSDASDFDPLYYCRLGIFVWEGYDDSIEFLPKKLTKSLILDKNETKVTLFNDLEDKNICIWVIKLSEAQYAYSGLKSIEIEGSIINSLGAQCEKQRIEVIGDSITSGYGVEGKDGEIFSTAKENSVLSYAFLLSKRLQCDYSFVSSSGIGLTSHWTEEDIPDISLLMNNFYPYTDRLMSQRLKLEPEVWDCKRFSPNKIFINIGTNDASFVKNKEDRKLLFIAMYKQLLEMIHRRSPEAEIYCVYGVMEQSLMDSIRNVVEIFSKEFSHCKIKFIPLELQKEKDGIGQAGHPSIITQEKICDTIYNNL